MADFLLELGFEEIPARMIAAAQADLQTRVANLLEREGLLPQESASAVTSYSTPRRLAVIAAGVAAKQQDIEEQLTGPAAKIAFKDGQPTAAAHAFAKKAGVDVSALQSTTTAKGEYVTATVKKAGKPAAEVLGALLPAEIARIAWPKSMYWRPGKPERMVRPLRWIVCLLDGDVVPVECAGVRAGRESRGHRILHGASPVEIAQPRQYESALEAASVRPPPEQRRHMIRKALDAQTRAVPGARWREDESLVETCVHLTEWPSVVLGNFDREFLALPDEVLVTVMRDHQKYFAVEDAEGKLAPHFLAVLNTQVDDDGAATIRHGNARVLRARFNDARFFWDTDQRIPLADRADMLKSVTFQKDLGSYWDKTQANIRLATALAEFCAERGTTMDLAAIESAARLAKADLTTELVKEFTELQGVVGGLYAAAQGHSATVANAIYDQYSAAPRSAEAAIVGLADRANTVVDMFALGLAPTGSKDPFALRRAANAIVRILAEQPLPLTLSRVFELAVQQSAAANVQAGRPAIEQFFLERLTFFLRESAGLDYDVANAVLAAGSDHVQDAMARGRALAAVRATDDFVAIAAAFKRIRNILSQAREKQIASAAAVDADFLKQPEERSLFAVLQQLSPRVEQLRQERNYASALDAIATLRPTVDAFFDKVMVMDPDAAVRANRLALLAALLENFSNIADFSLIAPAAGA